MSKVDKLKLEELLRHEGKLNMLPELLEWCKKNEVYNSHKSGWVISAVDECEFLSFGALYEKFENDLEQKG